MPKHSGKQPQNIRSGELILKSSRSPLGALNISQDNLFNGNIPKRIVIAMVDNDAYSGNYKKNPFNFKTNDLSFLGVYVDGEPLPGKPIQPKFDPASGLAYIMAFQGLFSGTGPLVSRSWKWYK